MKKILNIIVVIVSFSTVSLSGNYEQKFKEANNLYSQNKFEEALSLYNEIISGGFESADLYYNAANTSYRLNRVGESIYFYEKALQLNPNNEDYRYNLELAELRVKNIPNVLPKTAIITFFDELVYSASVKFWAKLSIGLFVLFLLLFFLYIKSQHSRQKKIMFLGSVIILFFSLLAVFFTQYQSSALKSDSTAIVIIKEFQAKSSPDNSATELFPIFEGYKVEIEDSSDDWLEIKLTDGKKAWIKEENIKRL
ncbi:MAG: tetratricopeptide repeat protein [Bacteroidales bacterium]|nr:tetratricopeptide repeat protein [Bacteroidales bacterium]